MVIGWGTYSFQKWDPGTLTMSNTPWRIIPPGKERTLKKKMTIKYMVIGWRYYSFHRYM
jgi:hypothetical protein